MLMLPAPDAVPHEAAADCPATEHVHVGDRMIAGMVSVNVELVAVCGPLLRTVIT